MQIGGEILPYFLYYINTDNGVASVTRMSNFTSKWDKSGSYYDQFHYILLAWSVIFFRCAAFQHLFTHFRIFKFSLIIRYLTKKKVTPPLGSARRQCALNCPSTFEQIRRATYPRAYINVRPQDCGFPAMAFWVQVASVITS